MSNRDDRYSFEEGYSKDTHTSGRRDIDTSEIRSTRGRSRSRATGSRSRASASTAGKAHHEEVNVYGESRSAVSAEGRSQRSRGRQAAKKKKRKKLIALIVVEVFVLLLIAGVGFGYFYVQSLWDTMETVSFEKEEVQTNEDLHQSVVEKSKGYTTIMLYGVDARNNKDLVRSANADTSIICCINNDTKEIKLVSVLRDTLVETTKNKHTKLNVVYAGYGVQEAIQTINKNFDLNITQYVTVNWKAVAQAVDALGGLDIELTSVAEAEAVNQFLDEVEEATGLKSDYIDERAGEQHLNGVQVTSYARVRNVGKHDIRRAERQRTVIIKMLEAAKGADLATLNKLITEVFPGISTNFTMTEILDLAKDVTSYSIADQTVFPFKYVDQVGGDYFVYCNDLVYNATELHKYLYNNDEYVPSSTVHKVSEYILDYKAEHP